ncbi:MULTISPECIES: SDR family oxidoreductase [Sphingobium]|jgi:NAD(P)-dependent dehydrogenase (short-subunit alcohol dehydrogenase family)|uniref:SDR family oxidoreductase n=1 Tax=Sphingobium TaxID=165695 RepID=UPI000C4C7E8B|nr:MULTISPECIES: SDR family oxidoreductase [Sphingobium]MBS48968.1 short-chain dehydrogenase [Sphingobium sp.]MCC4256291.1 SDR family oxidoreductase [Sphingobium lactosutens]MEC9017443.1 SDR family oxidoreductase [Pseudomonadota bacterium]HCW62005.1 short chain dehydrogenase [Sphingobium sp.]|tara:strand:+ start:3439 stop:4224 length:786 start_codon:yes stop_codon:yes gene_type:complete
MTFSIEHYRLDGKVAIVTGAGGRGNNIGRAYATGLAAAGAAVVVADINGEGAHLVADEIVAAGGKAIAVQVDITDLAAVDAMVAAAQAEFGGVDILVNNAALMVESVGTPLLDMPVDAWRRLMEVNLQGAVNCCRAALPLLEKSGNGRIVNQLSAGAFPAQTAYGVSKVAMLGLTTTLATELGPKGIAVNAIAPGMTQSDAGKMLTPDEGPLVDMMKMRIPLRMKGQPDELVGALLLLCSPAGAWITGQTINIDGGWVLRN